MSALVLRELTAAGRGAVRVLEVRGAGAWAHVRDRLCLQDRPAPFSVVRLRSASGDEVLDEALVMAAEPDRVELHLHGSPAVVRRVTTALGLAGAAAAQPWGGDVRPGTATLEDLADEALAGAPSEAAARMLLDQREGALRRALESFVGDPAAGAEALLERARIARHLLEPPVVLLVGAANAGKSTLFNALLDRERVLVAARAGTTRDAIRERVQLGRWVVDLVDTAGERGPQDAVEAAGQALARELRGEAGLVLRLVPWSADLELPRAGEREAVLVTQVDRADPGTAPAGVSALRDPGGARRLVEEALLDELDLPAEPWTAGAGVPFLPALAADLALAPGPARERVRAWLARPRER